jgi:energy-converting hydrogenase Eha subunit A
VVSRASAAGLVAAGLLSVIISPALGLVLLRRDQPQAVGGAVRPSPVTPVITAEDRALCRLGNAPTAA